MDSYFHREIFGYPARDFVIEATWCNPRDLVLLFGEAVSQAPLNEAVIGTVVIGRVFESYSTAAWREKAEELSVEYAPQEIQGIKKILLNLGRHFKVNGFEQSWTRKAETDQILTSMKSKYRSTKILEDLYRIGILGQSTRQPHDEAKSFTQHWTYRGDTSFDATAWFVVHKALWPELRLGKIGDRRQSS